MAVTGGWQAYLQGANSAETYGRCIREARPGFAALRELIARLADRLEPKEVVCLGAGALNDIPFRRFIRSGCKLHLVDWLPDIVEAGVQGSSMSEAPGGQSSCVFCELGESKAKDFCNAFDHRQKDQPGVCENFRRIEAPHLACENYSRGTLPDVYQEDVTGGFASSFAEAVTREIEATESWRGALKKALRIARHPPDPKQLPIESGSADMVISSMVMSQFEFEPYQYFTSRAVAAHGRPATGLTEKLSGGIDMLRDKLLAESIEGHCREIRRILRPDGHCFMAFEMHHRRDGAGSAGKAGTEEDGWFLVRQMHDAVPVLDRHFQFDFERLQAPDHVVELPGGNSRSLVYCYLLKPRIEPSNEDEPDGL